MEDPLYKRTIIEHFRAPRNRGRLPRPDRSAHIKSDSCGDELIVTVALREERVAELRYEGEGCAISQALASIASERYVGMREREILSLDESWVVDLLGTEVSDGRRSCANLHLVAIQAALRGLETGTEDIRATRLDGQRQAESEGR